MRFSILASAVLLLTSCASRLSQSESSERINNSNLYDPSTVTLIKGRVYQFKEGTLKGRGQKMHSDHSYMRALVAGQ